MNLDNPQSFIFYTTSEGKDNVQVYVDESGQTVWMTQRGMSEVFGCSTDNISLHLKNIFNVGELNIDEVTEESSVTGADGKNYKTKLYNLDAIISVGYRVNSQNATRFRIWATGILKEYLVKGFAMDDERLKQGKSLFDKDYFDELLERIKEIRASERRFYQKITDIYAQCSVDYNPNSPVTQQFYATVQNKLEFAITKQTAAENISTTSLMNMNF
ncbi:RhuM family protein [Fluviicola sp.]|uniref:RhuM family protein n=1 Tax=Fluviicola sp. TaxID=1917219 RepID=UPI0031D9DFF2